MIKRNQQPLIPLSDLGRILSQAEFMIMNELQRLKSYRPQSHNYLGLHQLNRASQKV